MDNIKVNGMKGTTYLFIRHYKGNEVVSWFALIKLSVLLGFFDTYFKSKHV